MNTEQETVFLRLSDKDSRRISTDSPDQVPGCDSSAQKRSSPRRGVPALRRKAPCPPRVQPREPDISQRASRCAKHLRTCAGRRLLPAAPFRPNHRIRRAANLLLRQHVLRSEKGFQFANESRVHEGPAAIWRGVPTIVIHAAGWQCRSPATRAVLV